MQWIHYTTVRVPRYHWYKRGVVNERNAPRPRQIEVDRCILFFFSKKCIILLGMFPRYILCIKNVQVFIKTLRKKRNLKKNAKKCSRVYLFTEKGRVQFWLTVHMDGQKRMFRRVTDIVCFFVPVLSSGMWTFLSWDHIPVHVSWVPTCHSFCCPLQLVTHNHCDQFWCENPTLKSVCRSISKERLDVSTFPLLLHMMKDMIKYM